MIEGTTRVTVQEAPFDEGAVIGRMRRASRSVGAVASFVGVCRDINDGDGVSGMWLEHYAGMTERAIEAIVDEARARWAIGDCEVVHRVGRIEPGEAIVLVAVSSMHRHEAFAACEFVMDFLKTRAPFWKKESTEHGTRWVDARQSDAEAAARWKD